MAEQEPHVGISGAGRDLAATDTPPPPPTPPFRLGFRPALDGIRGVAIVLVVCVHATYLLVPKYAGRFIPGGFIALDVFFVLSGFLITSLLVEERAKRGRVSMRGFYRRRALRLFPVLWTVMVVQLIYTLIVHDPLGKELKGLAAIALYFGNFSWKFHAVIPDTLGQAWSLAVEEQFYLVWPALLVLLLHFRNRRLTISVMVGLMGVAVVSRFLLFNAGVNWLLVYVQTETRLDALMMGSLLAYLLHNGYRLPRRTTAYGWLAAAFLILVVVTSHREDAWLFDGGFTLVAVAAAFVICAILDSDHGLGRMLAWAPVQLLGRMSYSIYLWHVLIFLGLIRAWPASSGVDRVVVGFTLTAIVSTLSHYIVEKPFLRRKDQGRRRGSAPGAAVGPAEASAPPTTPAPAGVSPSAVSQSAVGPSAVGPAGPAGYVVP
jgi:peptidoglycan/LPS O-acetylase OafA/YrhL